LYIINSKWIKDLNVRSETVRNPLDHIGIDNNFINGTPVAQQLGESTDRWDCMKLERFCTAKETLTGLKRHPTEWEKIFASYTSNKGLITKIYQP
jgi:hypothetical protein